MTLHITLHGQGKPLVLFHGWGYDQTIWHELVPKLGHHFQLCLVDLPGHGLSGNMAWDDFKVALLEQLPLQFAIAGWSMGGLFATRLAIETPLRVTHLLNIASTPRFIQDDDWPGVERLVFQTFCDDFIKNPKKVLKQFTARPTTWPASGATGLQAGLEALLTWDLRPKLAELQASVCYLFGRLDSITSHKIMPSLQSRHPNFKVILFRQAGHTPFLSHSNEFISLLETFLK